jgi:REP element-mobilizing transposase RayT
MGPMRKARIKIPAAEGEAVYHCISRTVNGEYFFHDVAKEVLRQQLWRVAEFCGVQVVTYAILSNHFHAVIRVPRQEPVSDAELLRRYRVLYPQPTKTQVARLEVIQAQLAVNGPEAVRWRERQLRLMGDISSCMKLLKQRFSIWYNKTHRRFGPVWSERFKSGLIGPGLVQTMAAYLDLNAVRAGLAVDPKDYRFCGYAEAVAGHLAARQGIQSVVGAAEWTLAQGHYREVLFGTGGSPRAGAASLPPAEVQRVLTQGGQLPLAEVLRCRLRFLTEGAIIGTRAFVAAQSEAYRRKTGQGGPGKLHAVPAFADWGDLTILRRPRRPLIG